MPEIKAAVQVALNAYLLTLETCCRGAAEVVLAGEPIEPKRPPPPPPVPVALVVAGEPNRVPEGAVEPIFKAEKRQR